MSLDVYIDMSKSINGNYEDIGTILRTASLLTIVHDVVYLSRLSRDTPDQNNYLLIKIITLWHVCRIL